jgi:hypothetical protein
MDHDSGRAVYAGSAHVAGRQLCSRRLITLYRKRSEWNRGPWKSALYQAQQKNAILPRWFGLCHGEFMVIGRDACCILKPTWTSSGNRSPYLGHADLFKKDGNEVRRTIAQKNVTIVQPGRRGTGDWCQYTTADEVAVLTGNPAHVEDAEQGTTDGNRLTMYRRENRVVADDTRGSQSPGRVRSTHKITKP